MKSVIHKLRSPRGETIGEVLVSLLISSLALMMLAAMIVSSGKLITKSKQALDDYYKDSKVLADHSTTPEPDLTVTVSDPDKPTADIYLSSGSPLKVKRYELTFTGKTIISYEK